MMWVKFGGVAAASFHKVDQDRRLMQNIIIGGVSET
ncbi:hypothetical protein ACUXSV_002967 [Sphingomonas sanguinis]